MSLRPIVFQLSEKCALHRKVAFNSICGCACLPSRLTHKTFHKELLFKKKHRHTKKIVFSHHALSSVFLFFVFYIACHLLKRVALFDPQHAKTDKMTCAPSILPVWSDSSLCALRTAKELRLFYADNEDSDQSGRMIWGFAGRTCHFVGFVTQRLIYNLLLHVWQVLLCLDLLCLTSSSKHRVDTNWLGTRKPNQDKSCLWTFSNR